MPPPRRIAIGLNDYPTSALVFAVLGSGPRPRGRDQDASARRQALDWADLALLTNLSPWYEAETRIVLARALLLLGRRGGRPHPSRRRGPLPAADLRRGRPWRVARGGIERGRLAASADGQWPLTMAELRLLHCLDAPQLPGDRRTALRLDQHGQDPGPVDLPQARRLLASRGGRCRRRGRIDRNRPGSSPHGLTEHRQG